MNCKNLYIHLLYNNVIEYRQALYAEVRFIKNLYLVLTQTGTLPSKTLKLYTKDPYNHISMGFDKNLNVLFSFGRKNLHNPLNGGFVQEGINKGLYSVFKDTICCVYEIKITGEEYGNLKSTIDKFNSEKDHYRYNFLGLLTALFGYPLIRHYHYYCTQFVGTVLYDSKVAEFEKDISFLKPVDFCNLRNSKLVYQGKLSDYKYIQA